MYKSSRKGTKPTEILCRPSGNAEVNEAARFPSNTFQVGFTSTLWNGKFLSATRCLVQQTTIKGSRVLRQPRTPLEELRGNFIQGNREVSHKTQSAKDQEVYPGALLPRSPPWASEANSKSPYARSAFQVPRASPAGRWLELCPGDVRHQELQDGVQEMPYPIQLHSPKSEGDLSHSQPLVYSWQWAHAVRWPKQLIAGFKVAING